MKGFGGMNPGKGPGGGFSQPQYSMMKQAQQLMMMAQ